MSGNSENNASVWQIYILRCADDSLYTGVTTDLDRRISEHNHDNRLAAKYTRVRRPVRLVYSESIANRADATRRERLIKKMTRKQKLALIGELT